MSIHSLVSLSNKHHYVNIVNSAIKYLQRILSPSEFKVWIALKEATSFTDGIFTGSHRLLAKITNMSVSTIIRALNKLINLDLAHKQINKADDGTIKANTYILEAPEHLLAIIKSSPLRKKPEIELEPDYSVQHDEIPEEVKIVDHVPESSKTIDKKERDIPKNGDTRGLLDLNAPQVGGHIGKMIERMKKLSTNGGGICQIETPLITILDLETNTNPETEPQTAIIASQEENLRKTPKSVSQIIVNKLQKFIRKQKLVSSPAELLEQAIDFVATRKDGYSEWRAAGGFVKLYNAGTWRTPSELRTRESKYDKGYENENTI